MWLADGEGAWLATSVGAETGVVAAGCLHAEIIRSETNSEQQMIA